MKEGERGGERVRERGMGGREGWEGEREREMWTLREAILFVGDVRKREEKNNRGKREKERDMIHMFVPCSSSTPNKIFWMKPCGQQILGMLCVQT